MFCFSHTTLNLLPLSIYRHLPLPPPLTRTKMSAAALAARSPCAASVSPRVEQQQQQQRRFAAGAAGTRGGDRGGIVVVSALSSPTFYSSSSSLFSSPRTLKNVLVGNIPSRSVRACTNSRSARSGNVSAAAAASSDETDVKPSALSASSTSTTTATTVPSPPTVPQDTIPDTPATFKQWELDFGSRPVLDERGKKWWELLIVAKGSDDDGSVAPWVYSRWLPNTKINSAQVRF